VIFRAILELGVRGDAIDSLSVIEELKRRGQLKDAGGKDAVSALASHVGAPGNAPHHARIVIELADLRA